ncbi:MAG: hypothetical protein GY938_13240 [Ketobacter sp.]|nr:hypothetical protein [Ketobacter sp.]
MKHAEVSERKKIFGRDYLLVKKDNDSVNVQQTWMNIFAMTTVLEETKNWINKAMVDNVVMQFGMTEFIKGHQIGTYLSHLAKIIDFPILKGTEQGQYVVDQALVGDLHSEAESAEIL